MSSVRSPAHGLVCCSCYGHADGPSIKSLIFSRWFVLNEDKMTADVILLILTDGKYRFYFNVTFFSLSSLFIKSYMFGQCALMEQTWYGLVSICQSINVFNDEFCLVLSNFVCFLSSAFDFIFHFAVSISTEAPRERDWGREGWVEFCWNSKHECECNKNHSIPLNFVCAFESEFFFSLIV